MTTARRGGPAALLALLTLLAVFAMHGPSSDHRMLMPMAEHGMATDVAVHELPGDRPQAASGDHGMRHADCLATLRGETASSAPADVVVTTAEPAGATAPVSSSVTADGRAPPRPPDLDRLCISRT